MARLTEEQKDALAVLCGEDLFGAIVESILRLDEPEEPAVDADAVRANQERTIEDLGEALASAIDERDEAMSKIVETERRAAREAADFVDRSFALECERDEARAKLAEYQAGSIAVRLAEVERERDEALAAQSSTVHAARAGWRARALASAIAERDEAKADHDALARAVGQALLVPTLGDNEEFVEPSDHAIVGAMLGMRNARDTALARLAKVEAERDEARAKLADVDRLLAIEEQAKRVARAEKWCEWARLAYLCGFFGGFEWQGTDNQIVWESRNALDMTRVALKAERRKLAEMVGEGEK